MNSLGHCRRELAVYNNEQLFMLEQLMRAWHGGKPAERKELVEQIRSCTQRFTLLEPFYRDPGRKPESVEMEKVCQLIMQAKQKPDELWQEFFRLLARLHYP